MYYNKPGYPQGPQLSEGPQRFSQGGGMDYPQEQGGYEEDPYDQQQQPPMQQQQMQAPQQQQQMAAPQPPQAQPQPQKKRGFLDTLGGIGKSLWGGFKSLAPLIGTGVGAYFGAPGVGAALGAGVKNLPFKRGGRVGVSSCMMTNPRMTRKCNAQKQRKK